MIYYENPLFYFNSLFFQGLIDSQIDDDQQQIVEIEGKTTEFVNTSKKSDVKPKNMTTKYLTKYERARLLGTRAQQISMGAPILVDPEGEMDPLMIAKRELIEKKIPFIIRRYFPDGSFVDLNAGDLEIISL